RMPGVEDCGTPYDQDCDGDPDNGCVCKAGETKACYTGPPSTSGVGACAPGTQTCVGGTGWSACSGEVLPQPLEDCVSGVDAVCDGPTPCTGATIWATAIDGAGEDSIEAAAIDARGAIVLAGYANVAVNGQNLTEADLFVAKVDAN